MRIEEPDRYKNILSSLRDWKFNAKYRIVCTKMTCIIYELRDMYHTAHANKPTIEMVKSLYFIICSMKNYKNTSFLIYEHIMVQRKRLLSRPVNVFIHLKERELPQNPFLYVSD